MTQKLSPQPSGAIQAKLTYLRRRKAVLDDLIRSLEQYAAPDAPPDSGEKSEENPPEMAGAA